MSNSKGAVSVLSFFAVIVLVWPSRLKENSGYGREGE